MVQLCHYNQNAGFDGRRGASIDPAKLFGNVQGHHRLRLTNLIVESNPGCLFSFSALQKTWRELCACYNYQASSAIAAPNSASAARAGLRSNCVIQP